jgi:hypothetical protein
MSGDEATAVAREYVPIELPVMPPDGNCYQESLLVNALREYVIVLAARIFELERRLDEAAA